MNRPFIYVLVVLLAILTPQTSAAQTYKGIPANSRKYVLKHFAHFTISHYERDEDLLDVEHKLYVTDNSTTYKLEFDRRGIIKEIESVDDKTPLPPSVIPVRMSQHVKGKFPQAKIIEWKRKKNTQVIELSNDIELVFSRNGDFLRIDD